jgi:hypothetical protein
MIRTSLLLAATALLLAVDPATAQDERALEVRRRNQCRLAAHVLDQGSRHPRHEWARSKIMNCEEEGPAYFAAQWTTARPDTAGLRQLIAGSIRIRDERVYASLQTVAKDSSRADAVRVAAMITLARYSNVSIAVDLSELRPPADTTRGIRFRGGSAIDVTQFAGTHRLGSVQTEVLATLRGIAANRTGESWAVSFAADVLARRVRAFDPWAGEL